MSRYLPFARVEADWEFETAVLLITDVPSPSASPDLTPMLAARAFARRNLRSARTFVGCRSIGTMFGENCPLVVTPTQLRFLKVQQSEPADLVVLDASWHMPNSPRNAQEDFLKRHIPSARFLDIDRVASPHPLSLH